MAKRKGTPVEEGRKFIETLAKSPSFQKLVNSPAEKERSKERLEGIKAGGDRVQEALANMARTTTVQLRGVGPVIRDAIDRMNNFSPAVLELLNATPERRVEGDSIPPEHRTAAMTLTEAARKLRYSTRKAQDAAGRKKVEREIKCGTLHAERTAPKSRKWWFDKREIPDA